MSTWIEMLPVENATGSLKEAYDLAKTPAGTVDNVMRIHSQRPQTMVGHLTLYRSVLHHQDNTLPLWFLEAVGVFTSLLYTQSEDDPGIVHVRSNPGTNAS